MSLWSGHAETTSRTYVIKYIFCVPVCGFMPAASQQTGRADRSATSLSPPMQDGGHLRFNAAPPSVYSMVVSRVAGGQSDINFLMPVCTGSFCTPSLMLTRNFAGRGLHLTVASFWSSAVDAGRLARRRPIGRGRHGAKQLPMLSSIRGAIHRQLACCCTWAVSRAPVQWTRCSVTGGGGRKTSMEPSCALYRYHRWMTCMSEVETALRVRQHRDIRSAVQQRGASDGEPAASRKLCQHMPVPKVSW